MRAPSLSLIAIGAMSSFAVAQTAAPSTSTSLPAAAMPPAVTAPAPSITTTPPTTTTAPAPSGPTAGLTGGLFANVRADELMASNLIDLEVYNQANENIGEIEDI